MSVCEVLLPREHAAQKRVLAEASRFNVVDCGRRWGKTKLAVNITAEAMLDGLPCGWFAPGYKYLLEPWMSLKKLLEPVTARVSEVEKRLDLITGGYVEMWSLESVDAGRSRGYGLAVIDEAAMVRNLEQAWNESIRPALADWEGKAWFLSTPKGRDFFSKCYDLGQDPKETQWASWMMPTSTNPFIQPGEIDAARAMMPPRSFAQEFEAMFLDIAAGGVFEAEWFKVQPLANTKLEVSRIVVGVDLAVTEKTSADFTAAFPLIGSTDGYLYFTKPYHEQVEWPKARRNILSLASRINAHAIGVERAGQQGGLISNLREESKTPVIDIPGNRGDKESKARAWSPLAYAGRIILLEDGTGWTKEFLREASIFPFGGVDDHDDLVDAMGIALETLRQLGVDKAPYKAINTAEIFDQDAILRRYGIKN